MDEYSNPYSDFGRIVSGVRFIGRDDVLARIRRRATGAGARGSLALVGDTRIGKSSIAWRAVMERRDELLGGKTVPVWVNLNLCAKGWDLFRQLAEQTMRAFEDNGWPIARGTLLPIQRIRAATGLDGESSAEVLSFFEACSRAGVRVIAVLDEFDHARELWHGDAAGFQLLRELAQSPDTSMTLLTTSRRSIGRIEVLSGVISTLEGIFHIEHVTPFLDVDAEEFFARLGRHWRALAQGERGAVGEIAGSHPYLLDVVAFHLCSSNPAEGDVVAICEDAAREFLPHYRRVLSLMEDDGSASKLVQVIFGPAVDLSPGDVDSLLQSGIVHAEGSGIVAFSRHFGGFMAAISREVDVWPLWRDTEVAVRRVVGQFLEAEFGADWERTAHTARPKWEKMLDQWKESREKEGRRYGTGASADLLDYSYPAELFQVITGNWSWFGKVFPGQPKSWERPFEVLSGLRTPMAHNRGARLSKGLVMEATGVCTQVVEHIRQFEARDVTAAAS